MTISLEELSRRAEVLIEALPYIREFYGKTIVVKYGGHAMTDPRLKQQVMNDIILMKYVGMKPVLIHGGGPQISELMRRVGKEAQFVNGLRVTDAETAGLAEMVLVGTVNKEIVSLLNQMGGKAVGLSGKDANLIRARKHYPTVKNGSEVQTVDIGYVGEITEVNTEIIEVLDAKGFIPVIAGTGVGEKGETYNINADTAAGKIAAALRAEKLILLSDVRGVLRNPEDPDSLISTIRVSEVPALREAGVLSKGMIPKVEACVVALEGGVRKAHIIDGRIPHSLLLEIFTDTGIGTMIVPD
ncbi:MAG: acetylglutamate kinase [Candidatus Poribacteria bacterium]|nr:MAG: acetylglutamate kinase [Candidatus Poribacteria bacterium]